MTRAATRSDSHIAEHARPPRTVCRRLQRPQHRTGAYRYVGKECGIRGSRRRPCSGCSAEIFRASRSAQARCCGPAGIRSASDGGEKVAGIDITPRCQFQDVSFPESAHSAQAGRGISLRLRADTRMNALAPPLRSQARPAIALMGLRRRCLAAGGRQTDIFDVKPSTGGAQRDLLDLRWDTVKHQHKASALAVADVEL